MKMNQNYKEYDMEYKGFDLSETEIKTVSDYFGYEFNPKETHLLCMYDLNGNLLVAQINEESTWDLMPDEVEKIFGNKLAA
jgi:hypothetical protein